MSVHGNVASSQDHLRALEAGLIDAVAQWCECLHGLEPLLVALKLLGTGIEAEAVALSRARKVPGGEARAVIWDSRPASVPGGRLERTYAMSVLGAYVQQARPGSLWFSSMLEGQIAADLEAFHNLRRLRELVIVPLEMSDRSIDMLEIHFSEKTRAHQQAILNALSPVLMRTWQHRARGLFTEALLRTPPRAAQSEAGIPILSADNPARLSRAEYRVCLLLSRGRTLEELKAELGIGESTLRTHLGNLYAKTGSGNLGELIYRLVSAVPFAPGGGRPGRVA